MADPVNQLTKEISKYAIVFNVAAFILVWIITGEFLETAAGIFLGGAVAILMFMELGRTLQKAVTMNSGRAQAFATMKYSLRFAVTAVVVLLALKAPYISDVGTILGLLSVKLVVWGKYLFEGRQSRQNHL